MLEALSMPPAIITSADNKAILCAAVIVAFIPN